jgi:hypothetical protein
MNAPSGELVSGLIIGAILGAVLTLAVRGLCAARGRRAFAEPWAERSSSAWAPRASALERADSGAAGPPAAVMAPACCASCSSPLPMRTGGLLPPWCPACGADVKRGPQKPAPAAPTEPATPAGAVELPPE